MTGQAVAPSGTRHKVIGFAVTLAVLSYIDRVCISQAAPIISKEFGLNKGDMGSVFAAFALAYALFEIPGGWMGDWMGPRKVLMRIVIWWSFFTAITGFMWDKTSLMVARFLFGAGEAGCFPNLTKSFTTWLPIQERVRAQGILWMSARWGGAFTPLLVVFMFKLVSWRTAFVIFGALGLVWAVAFYLWYRDDPRQHPEVNKGELDIIGDAVNSASGHGNVPWAKLLASRSVWLLWIQYFLLSYSWYFYITWLPTYLQEKKHLSPEYSAILGALPLFLGGIGCLLSGLVAPWLTTKTGDLKKTRRLLSSVGFLCAALLVLAFTTIEDPLLAMICIGFASFFNDIVMPPSWGACMDVGGKFAGTLSGSMNMVGNLAGAVAPLLGGYILQATNNNWTLFFYSMVASYVLGSLLWPMIDPVTPIEADAH